MYSKLTFFHYGAYYSMKKICFFMLIGSSVVHTHIEDKSDSRSIRSPESYVFKQLNIPSFHPSNVQISITVRFLPSAWFWNKEQNYILNATIRKKVRHYVIQLILPSGKGQYLARNCVTDTQHEITIQWGLFLPIGYLYVKLALPFLRPLREWWKSNVRKKVFLTPIWEYPILGEL